jgi:hypothetical protein
MKSLVALLLLGACAGEDMSDARGTVETESAGIRIIETGPIPADLPVWRLTGEVLVDIGQVEGEAPYILDGVRDAERLDDGRIAILDGSAEVRLFDSDGVYLAAFGGEGDGPGRFNAPRGLWQRGDSLVVWDMALRRTTVFPIDGGDPRVIVPIDVHLVVGTQAHAFGDALVARTTADTHVDESRRRTTAYYVTLPLDGGPPDTLDAVDLGIRTAVATGVGGINMLATPVFSGTPVSAAGGGRFVHGLTALPELRIREQGDTTHRIIRWSAPGIEVTAEHVDTHVEGYRGSVEIIRAQIDGAGVADSFPRFAGLLVGPEHIWIGDYPLPGYDGPTRWTVFGAHGSPAARAELPDDLTVYRIGSDYVLGRRSDEFGVQHVVLLQIAPG